MSAGPALEGRASLAHLLVLAAVALAAGLLFANVAVSPRRGL